MNTTIEKLPTACTPAAWREETPPAAAAETLVLRYLPLVRNVVQRIKLTLPAHVDADDLYSVGVTGLMAAAGKFDASQDQTFPGYAAMRIRGAILDELRRLDWCPRRTRARSRKVRNAINEVERRLGRAATDREICSELGIGLREYHSWVEEARPATFIALDEQVDGPDGAGPSPHESLADESDRTGRDNLERDELRRLVAQRISELPDIPKKILAMYYFEKMRLAEIAQVFDLSESRICQIHGETISALRGALERDRNL